MHPYIVRVRSRSITTQLPCATREQAQAVIDQQLLAIQENCTIEVWEWLSAGHYQRFEGYDKWYEPTIQYWDVNTLSDDDDATWDGQAATYPFQSEPF